MKKRLSLLYILPHFYLFTVAFLNIDEYRHLFIPDILSSTAAFMILPSYGILIGLPGYLYAWYGYYDQQLVRLPGRIFIATSLWLTLIACLCGLLSDMIIEVFPGIAGATLGSASLLRKFHSSSTKYHIQ